MDSSLNYIFTAYVEDLEGTPFTGGINAREFLAAELIAHGVQSFTLTDAAGWYYKKSEKALRLEVIDVDSDPNLLSKINRALSMFCRAFDQDCALVTRSVVTIYESTKESYR